MIFQERKNMKRSETVLLCVFERDMPTVELMEKSFRRIFVHENISIVFKKNKKVSNKDIHIADVIILIRPHNFLSQKIAERGKQSGGFIITFMDDDMLNYPAELPTISWRKRSLKRVLKISDLLLTSNPYVAKKYTKFSSGNRSAIVDTSLSEEEVKNIPIMKTEGGTVKLVYAASAYHTVDIKRFLLPLLNFLNVNCEKKISMTFVGVNPDIDSKKFGFNIYYKEAMTLKEYRNWMTAQKFDIGFAPLSDDSFSKYKYFNKFFEYTIAGIPAIYSNRDPYKLVIKNGINGFLVEDDINKWGETALSLINNYTLRKNCVTNAINLIKDKYNDNVVLTQFKSEIPELFQKRKHIKKCKGLVIYKVLYRFFIIMDSLYMICFYTEKDGLSRVLLRTMNHFKIVRMYSKQ